MKKINVHIIMAMQGEAAFVIKKLKLTQSATHMSGVDVYIGELGSFSIHLFVHQKHEDMDKIGTVSAALLTYQAIMFLKPDVIFSVGTSGGIHDHNVNVFDIICSSEFVIYHDRFTGDDEKSMRQSIGFLPCIDYKQYLEKPILDDVFHNIKFGVVGSSNSFFVDPHSWILLHKYNVLCVDMEAASVAEVARMFSIPFSAFKVVTDKVYEVNPIDSVSQFLFNFDAAMAQLAEKLFEILSHSSMDCLIGSGSNSIISSALSSTSAECSR